MINFRNLKSFSELASLSEHLFPTLCSGLTAEHSERLTSLFEQALNNYDYLFADDIFIKVNDDQHCLLEYILPAIRKAYYTFFINLPSLFTHQYTSTQGKNNRLELFQLQFELEDFLKFLSTKFKKNHNILDDFENLDKYSELLTLIVEEYKASKVSFVASVNSSEIESEIRDIKLTRHLSI